MKSWTTIFLLASALLLMLLFNFDPIGDALEKTLGPGSDRWVTNAVLGSVVLIAFLKKK